MFWKRDHLVEALIEKNLARPIPGMEKPDLARVAKLVGRKQIDDRQEGQRRKGRDRDLERGPKH